MEKKYYKGIDITYLDENDYSYLYDLSDKEIAEDKEFLEVKNKAKSLTKNPQFVIGFSEGYYCAKNNEKIKEGVKIWKDIFKHEGKTFNYNKMIEYAKKGWEYYFLCHGVNLPKEI